MKVLVDYHHNALLTSFYKLFVGRLGWTMYIPMGMDWYERDYWSVEDIVKSNPRMELAKQYLRSPTLPDFTIKSPEQPKLEYAYLSDIENGLTFDIVLSSVPCRFHSFEKLIADFGMRAKHIFQAGNNFSHNCPHIRNVKNLMSSATGPYHYYLAPNKIHYHQEFDLGLFRPTPKECILKTLTNFQHFMCRKEMFHTLEITMPEWRFRSFGAGNRESPLNGIGLVSAWMRQAGFVWHVKTLDEGYGHTIHNAFACGKPLITDTSYMTVYHQGTIQNTACALYTPETIIDIKDMSVQDIRTEVLRRADNYDYYSGKVYQKFKEIVDFDREFVEIKAFLERLI
jgi:hypothetical protein